MLQKNRFSVLGLWIRSVPNFFDWAKNMNTNIIFTHILMILMNHCTRLPKRILTVNNILKCIQISEYILIIVLTLFLISASAKSPHFVIHFCEVLKVLVYFKNWQIVTLLLLW